MIIKARIWKFGDDVDTDLIIPAQYLNSTEEKFLARHCLEAIHPNFFKSVKPGDVIVAGRNFGCGSSREHAPLAIKGCGIACVVAKSFARIFFRNAINIGLPLVESAETVDGSKNADRIEIDLAKGLIIRAGAGRVKKMERIEPFPDFLQGIVKAGGLMKYQMKRQKRGGRRS